MKVKRKQQSTLDDARMRYFSNVIQRVDERIDALFSRVTKLENPPLVQPKPTAWRPKVGELVRSRATERIGVIRDVVYEPNPLFVLVEWESGANSWPEISTLVPCRP